MVTVDARGPHDGEDEGGVAQPVGEGPVIAVTVPSDQD